MDFEAKADLSLSDRLHQCGVRTGNQRDKTYSPCSWERKLNLNILKEESSVMFIFFINVGTDGVAWEGILGKGGTCSARSDSERRKTR